MLLIRRVRQHGNFVEWTTFVPILMILAKGMGAPALYLHIAGALLVIGRIAHPFGRKADNAGHPLRATPCALWATAPTCLQR